MTDVAPRTTLSTLDPDDVPTPEPQARRHRRATGRRAERALFVYTWLVIAWLCTPIAVMIMFGFNNTQGRYNTVWNGFTLKWYGRLFDIPALSDAIINSLILAVLDMLIAGALGTMLGLALGKYRFRGQGVTNLVMFATISSPELVMGASLLSFFVTLGVGLGMVTILIAHVMFSISFVAVIVRSRVITLDPNLEEAARDLGANPFTTFWLVTFPMIFPAVLSGGLLAFALSIDDFVITQFNSGTTITFPLWIWGATRLGLPPQVNVMGTLIFAVGLVIAVANAVVARRRARR
ncbi:MAG TPA: ABC transporter permease [Micromonosporaceae bacterium]|jgi:spermidine/putrescine transport system permease protein